MAKINTNFNLKNVFLEFFYHKVDEGQHKGEGNNLY